MSGWDSNPFGGPTEKSSAFDDPSVTSAASTTDSYAAWAEQQAHLFQAPAHSTTSPTATTSNTADYAPSRPPPPARPTQPKATPYPAPKASGSGLSSPYATPSPSGGIGSSSSGDSAREAALRAKEEALLQREQELEERERRLEESGLHPPNWPPFPLWCVRPFKPIIYHNIAEEIPQQYQKLVGLLFKDWVFTCFCWILNCIGCFAAFVGCSDCTDTGISFALSLIFACVFCPASFVCWYRVLYNGLKKGKTLNFFMFFFIFGFQIGFNILYCLGVPATGAAGWIVGFMAINKNNVVAVILIVIGFFWTVNALLSLYLIKQVHTLYKGTGATVQDAQREAVIAAASNKTIRDGAKDAILRNAV